MTRLPQSPRWLIIILLLGTFGLPPSRADEKLFGVAGAFQAEIDAIKTELGVSPENGWTVTVIHGLQFWRGTYHGKEIVVMRTGTSIANAAAQLQLALDRFPITHVLFAGIAGGIDPAIDTGDVVVPQKWAYHDEGALFNEDGEGGYVIPKGYTPELPHRDAFFPQGVTVISWEAPMPQGQRYLDFSVNEALFAAAQRAAAHLPDLAGRTPDKKAQVIVGGTGVSGSLFMDNKAHREWIFEVWSANCLDMESAALAQVALMNRTPILVVRGISDLAGGQHGENEARTFLQIAAGNAARMLRATLDEL